MRAVGIGWAIALVVGGCVVDNEGLGRAPVGEACAQSADCASSTRCVAAVCVAVDGGGGGAVDGGGAGAPACDGEGCEDLGLGEAPQDPPEGEPDGPPAGRPELRVSPEGLRFGPVSVGGRAREVLTVRNSGSAPLVFEGLIVGGSPAFGVRLNGVDVAADPALLADPDGDGQPGLDPGARFELIVIYSPREEGADAGELVLRSDSVSGPEVRVALEGRGVINDCPVPAVAEAEFNVEPLDVVTLDGGPSGDPDGSIQAYEWVVVERPAGSVATLMERFNDIRQPAQGGRPDDPATPRALFFVDLAGAYVFELRVTDNLGLSAPSDHCPEVVARVSVVAVPNAEIHVQLVWDTPGDADQTDEDGTDVDLHLRHPLGRRWSQAPLDCYFANKRPEWGPPGPPGDPSLDIDDVNGAGPENINVQEPEDTAPLGGPYLVGVHYYRAEGFQVMSYGPSLATVRVFLGGRFSGEFQRELRVTDNFWEVAGIEWAEGEGRLVELERFWEDLNAIGRAP